MAALGHPAHRLREELYAVHLPLDPVPPAIDSADTVVVSSVVARLARLAGGGSDEALHDLAVITHASVVESNDLDVGRWSSALSRWREVWRNDAFWLRVRLRAEALVDDGAVDAIVGALHDELPARVLAPSAAMVAGLLDSGRDSEAVEHYAAILESGFPADAVEQACSTAMAGLRSQANIAIYDARQLLETARTDMVGDSSRLSLALRRAWARARNDAIPPIDRMRRVDQDRAEVRALSDELAELLRSLGVRLYNALEDGEAALAALLAAERLATSDFVRQQVAENLRAFRSNLAPGWVHARAGVERPDPASTVSASRGESLNTQGTGAWQGLANPDVRGLIWLLLPTVVVIFLAARSILGNMSPQQQPSAATTVIDAVGTSSARPGPLAPTATVTGSLVTAAAAEPVASQPPSTQDVVAGASAAAARAADKSDSNNVPTSKAASCGGEQNEADSATEFAIKQAILEYDQLEEQAYLQLEASVVRVRATEAIVAHVASEVAYWKAQGLRPESRLIEAKFTSFLRDCSGRVQAEVTEIWKVRHLDRAGRVVRDMGELVIPQTITLVREDGRWMLDRVHFHEDGKSVGHASSN